MAASLASVKKVTTRQKDRPDISANSGDVSMRRGSFSNGGEKLRARTSMTPGTCGADTGFAMVVLSRSGHFARKDEARIAKLVAASAHCLRREHAKPMGLDGWSGIPLVASREGGTYGVLGNQTWQGCAEDISGPPPDRCMGLARDRQVWRQSGTGSSAAYGRCCLCLLSRVPLGGQGLHAVCWRILPV